jgi:hypothetical protein
VDYNTACTVWLSVLQLQVVAVVNMYHGAGFMSSDSNAMCNF